MSYQDKYHNGNSFPGANGFDHNHKTATHLNGSSADHQEESEIDLKEVALMLWAKKWLIGSCILVCGLLGYVIASVMTPIYESRGSLLITDTGTRYSQQGGITSMMTDAFGIGVGSSLNNALLILQSRSLSMAIADSLMDERVMPNGRLYPVLYMEYPDDSTLAPQTLIAYRLRDRLAFTQISPEADFIQINYESPSAYAAGHVINVTMDLYSDFSTRRKRSSAGAAVNFLDEERARIQDSLYQAEEDLRVFMNSSGLIQVDTQTQELIKKLSAVEAALYASRAKLGAVSSAITKYEDRLNNIKPGLAEQLANATAPNMKRLQTQLAELRFEKTRILTRNPGIEQQIPVPKELATLNRKIGDYKQEIEALTRGLMEKGDQYLSFLSTGSVSENIAEINKNLIELRVQQQQYQAEVNLYDEQVAKLDSFFNELPDNIIKLARLKREVMLNENIFGTISNQLAQMSLLKETQFGLGQPIDQGFIPEEPSKPNTLLFILVGFILGAIGSTGYVFMREAFNTSIDSVEKLRSRQEPLLSVIPQMNDHTKEYHQGREKVNVKDKTISTKMVTILDSISPIAESFRRLQNNLIYSNPDSTLKTILLTSPGKGAGKTTTISNLGVVLAEAGNSVVIVETDLRRANVHNTFGIPRSPGFMEHIFDGLPLEDALQETVVSGLFVLPSGRKVPNPSVITQSKAFLQAIKSLEESFDYVLLDTPPYGIITDSSPLIKQSDGVIVTVRFNQTTDVQLDITMEELHRIDAPILGVVLNDFDYKKSNDLHYVSYYKESYKDYNNYEEDPV